MSSIHIQSMIEDLMEKNPHDVDKMRVHGFIYMRVFDPTNDSTKEERLVPNLITNKGFGKYLENLFAAAPTTVTRGTFLAIGTTASSLSATDTALQGEIAVVRGVGTFSHTADTAQGTVAYTFGTGGPWAILEMGLFDLAAAGTMICRGTFAAVNKGTADTFEAKYIHSLS
jgi:hypothetical protein